MRVLQTIWTWFILSFGSFGSAHGAVFLFKELEDMQGSEAFLQSIGIILLIVLSLVCILMNMYAIYNSDVLD